MEAVVIEKPARPPPKTAADLPKLPPSTRMGKVHVIDIKEVEKATDSKAITPFVAVSNDMYTLETVKGHNSTLLYSDTC
jgi:hypothetical protein